MGNTKIEWTSGPNGEEGYTFNPWLGCAKVHAGCTNCYAEVSQAVSMRKGGPVQWGEVWQGGQRSMVADSTWKHPFTWARAAAKAGERRKVFCASLADVLEVPRRPDRWPSEWSPARIEQAIDQVETTARAMAETRQRLFTIIRETAMYSPARMNPRANMVEDWWGLDWLLLTKRPENWNLIPEDIRPLVWLGTSISDQKTADEYVPRLLDTHGFRYRFLSCEPMVGPVDLSHAIGDRFCMKCTRGLLWDDAVEPTPAARAQFVDPECELACPHCGGETDSRYDDERVSWVVFGFESGRKARHGHVDWIRQGLKQCQEAGVAAFVKQLGARPRMNYYEWRRWAESEGWADENPILVNGKEWNLRDGQPPLHAEAEIPMKDPKGGDPSEWPPDLNVRQWPNAMEAHS